MKISNALKIIADKVSEAGNEEIPTLLNAASNQIEQLKAKVDELSRYREAVEHERIAYKKANLELNEQVEAWKTISGKHLEVASFCLEENRRLLLKTFIAGCDAGQKYGSNPFERDRQFDYFMADLKQEAKG